MLLLESSDVDWILMSSSSRILFRILCWWKFHERFFLYIFKGVIESAERSWERKNSRVFKKNIKFNSEIESEGEWIFFLLKLNTVEQGAKVKHFQLTFQLVIQSRERNLLFLPSNTSISRKYEQMINTENIKYFFSKTLLKMNVVVIEI